LRQRLCVRDRDAKTRKSTRTRADGDAIDGFGRHAGISHGACDQFEAAFERDVSGAIALRRNFAVARDRGRKRPVQRAVDAEDDHDGVRTATVRGSSPDPWISIS
jgi:hypothetical protein